jgi:hypothetical protein
VELLLHNLCLGDRTVVFICLFGAKQSNAGVILECKLGEQSNMYEIDFEKGTITGSGDQEGDIVYSREGKACGEQSQCYVTQMNDTYIKFNRSYRNRPRELKIINRKTGNFSYEQDNWGVAENAIRSGSCSKVEGNKF